MDGTYHGNVVATDGGRAVSIPVSVDVSKTGATKPAAAKMDAKNMKTGKQPMGK